MIRVNFNFCGDTATAASSLIYVSLDCRVGVKENNTMAGRLVHKFSTNFKN